MPRLVRRRPLMERLKAYFNPLDFLLWASEEFETRDWDQKRFATPAGFVLHLIFLIARVNSGGSRKYDDDVFGDHGSGSGWLAWFVCALLPLASSMLTCSSPPSLCNS